jgi:hypothetical protein
MAIGGGLGSLKCEAHGPTARVEEYPVSWQGVPVFNRTKGQFHWQSKPDIESLMAGMGGCEANQSLAPGSPAAISAALARHTVVPPNCLVLDPSRVASGGAGSGTPPWYEA